MRARVFLAAALALGGGGCTYEAYCWNCHDGTTFPTGSTGSGAGATTGSTGTGGDVLFQDAGPGGSGGGDDGGEPCAADTQSDPQNCGACGHVCDLLGAFPKCVAGVCVIDTCALGHHDVNGVGADGCEYACTETNGGVEACDGLDNDCDGQIDEGFDLHADPQNCGVCGHACAPPHASAGCVEIQGVPTCVVASCEDGWADLDGLGVNGCEYTCPVWPTTAEVCNDKDDDCDGQVNEGDPGGGQPCADNCPGGVCLGACTAGTTVCAGTTLLCVGGAGPTLEVCDGVDNDCDGQVDEGFDLLHDARNCGACGHVCAPPHGVGVCNGGVCAYLGCQIGWGDADGDPQNGCEYACPVVPPTVETCNGLDDDCDGVVDDAAAIAAQKPPAAGCYPKPGTPCAGADFHCAGASGWRCLYGPGVEVDGSGKLALVEARCDGIDGNCNGQVDEAFGDLGSACDNGLLGACRDVGRRICDPADPTATTCDLSVAPDPVPGAPHAETCNGVDDDCNGLVDDGIQDDMILVSVGATSFRVDRYEASRPDATSTSPGLDETRRCVSPGVLPWTFATQAEAAAACARTGARLCTAAELQAACEAGLADLYPYGMSYQPLTCNGLDLDGLPGGANDDLLLPTGAPALAACVTPAGVHDLSGNAAEWTSTQTGTTGAPLNLPIFVAKGGSYKTPALGLTCQFTLSRYAANAILPELGFRCCHD